MPSNTGVTIHIPRELRADCGGASSLAVSAVSVKAALVDLERRYASLYRNICDETGSVRRHINLFVNSTHVRERDGLATLLVPGDVLTILPAVSGG